MPGDEGAIHVRLLRPDDLTFADHVRAQVGWNQTPADWRRFLQLEPNGCFIAEWNNSPAGTATTLVHGPAVGWIGMVLVHPDFRRRGIGRALLEHCIESLRDRGVRCIKLDATPLGKQVYDMLGFRDEWTFNRWEHPGWQPKPRASTCRPDLRSWQPTDPTRLEALDAAAFGVSRRRLLQALASQNTGAWAVESPSGRLTGYGMLRPGSMAAYLGPVTASDAAVGLDLCETLLEGVEGKRVFWDIPDPNTAAVDWAREHGFKPQRLLTRMYLGENTTAGRPEQQFALTGPETG